MQFKIRKLKGFNSDKHRPFCLRLLVNILNISIRPSASEGSHLVGCEGSHLVGRDGSHLVGREGSHLDGREMMVFRSLLCTLFRLNWAKQTPGIMRRN